MSRPPLLFDHGQTDHCPEVEVIIEIPRWSFLKRGSGGHVDFVSPFPCPFNYGAVETHIGLEGDLLDAVVLGPRVERGQRITVFAFDAIGLTDRSLYDDKLICSRRPPSSAERRFVRAFFAVYAKAKGALNLVRGQSGTMRCEGWTGAKESIARARPRRDAERNPTIGF